MVEDRGQFSSRLGFILAAAGSAVGLGNLVAFPVMASKNGGAAFLFIYIGFVALVCYPVMLSEIAMGRKSQRNPVGAFSQKKLPKVPDNVHFQIGMFDKTIPGFLEEHTDPVAFLHVDCDLYSSTVTIFEAFGPRLQPGAIVLFDEYYNFPRWQQHEYKAFQEFVGKNGIKYEYIGYSVTGQQVAVRILENPISTDG